MLVQVLSLFVQVPLNLVLLSKVGIFVGILTKNRIIHGIFFFNILTLIYFIHKSSHKTEEDKEDDGFVKFRKGIQNHNTTTGFCYFVDNTQ